MNKFFNSLLLVSDKYYFIICEDLNTQHPTWGSTRSNHAGLALSEALLSVPLTIVNNGSGTRVSTNNSHISVPDISLISPSLVDSCFWRTLEDPMGSDHIPIVIHIGLVSNFDASIPFRRPKLFISKLNKKVFHQLTSEVFETMSSLHLTGAEYYDKWHNLMLDCCFKAGAYVIDNVGNVIKYNAEKNRLIITGNCSNKKNSSLIGTLWYHQFWWDQECDSMIKQRAEAYKLLKDKPSRKNLLLYRVISHTTRLLIRKKKR